MVLVLIGASGSGKSTFAQEVAKGNTENNWAIVSSDAIRAEHFGDEKTQLHNSEVFRIAYRQLKNLVHKGRNVIFDATNLTRKDRAHIFEHLKDENVDISCAYFKIPAGMCKARQALRPRRVPNGVVEHQCNRLEPPTADEGWHTIITIKN